MSGWIKPNDICENCTYLSYDKCHCVTPNSCSNFKNVHGAPSIKFVGDKESTASEFINDVDKDLEKVELVSHPIHYNKDGRDECWVEMKNAFSTKDVVIFDILTAYKYYYRAGLKIGNSFEQDIEKAYTYMNHAQNKIMQLASNGCDVKELSTKCIYMKDLLDSITKEVKSNGD
jgi:hypothetical protein